MSPDIRPAPNHGGGGRVGRGMTTRLIAIAIVLLALLATTGPHLA
jgi:hypothetical protein